ncbi:MAG: hypothetical protein U0176_07335 [Bacteroidia bacterium]
METSIRLLEIDSKYLKYIPEQLGLLQRIIPLIVYMWYFIRAGSAPEILLVDSDEKISLHHEYERLMLDSSSIENFKINDEKFEITHIRLRSSVQNKHSLVYSATSGVVKEENLAGKVPGLFGLLNDGTEDFTYTCFLTADFLTNNVTSDIGWALMYLRPMTPFLKTEKSP